jgi:hypothetical protein
MYVEQGPQNTVLLSASSRCFFKLLFQKAHSKASAAHSLRCYTYDARTAMHKTQKYTHTLNETTSRFHNTDCRNRLSHRTVVPSTEYTYIVHINVHKFTHARAAFSMLNALDSRRGCRHVPSHTRLERFLCEREVLG